MGVEDGRPIDTVRADGVVRFDPFSSSSRLAAGDDDEVYRETFVLPFGGDVDGDGGEDVLQIEVAFGGDGAPSESVFVARNGTDGRELWRAELGAGVYWAGYLVGDTTGDARPDLAFTTLEDVVNRAFWPPPGIACFDCYKWVETATTRLLSLDGASGEFRWQQQRDVVWAYQEQPISLVWLRNQAQTNGMGALTVLPDMDGDDGREILWTPWTSTFAEVYAQGAIPAQSTQVAEAIALAGGSGDQMWELDLRGQGGTYGNRDTPVLAGAWAGPDGSGDGIADVYTSEIVETPAKTVLTRRGIDGATGEELWLQRRDWDSDGRVLRGEYLSLGDDGLIFTLTAPGLGSDVEAIDPATGAVRWEHLGRDALAALPGGDVGGDQGEDLFYFGYDPDAETVTFEGVSGADGATISRRVLDVSGMSWLFVPGPLLDHSGDGAVDPIVFGGRATTGGIEDRVTITDLTDGTELWGAAGGAAVPTFWLPASDLDGAGQADVLVARLHDGFEDPEPRIELAALRGPDGVELWERDRYRTGPPEETIWSVGLGFMRDANGAPGDDLLVSSLNAYGAWAEPVLVPQVDLLNGPDGTPYLRLL